MADIFGAIEWEEIYKEMFPADLKRSLEKGHPYKGSPLSSFVMAFAYDIAYCFNNVSLRRPKYVF